VSRWFLFLWNNPHPLSPNPIWAGDLTEDMQRLGVSAQFCLSMTGEIRVCRWRVRGGKFVQQFQLHSMGRALPVSHVYLGVLLNCDAKKKKTIFRSPGRKYYIYSGRETGSVNTSLPAQNNMFVSHVADWVTFQGSILLLCSNWVRKQAEGRRGNGELKSTQTYMQPEPVTPQSQCSKIFCGRPHQSVHMPTLPKSRARLSTSNSAVYAADSIDNSRSTTDLTSRAGSYILQCSCWRA